MLKNNKILSEGLQIEITSVCKSNCLMCPRKYYKFKHGFMTNELFKNIIDQSINLNVKGINLTGIGESFLDPNIKDKIKYAYNKGLKIYTNTPGCDFEYDDLDWICEYFNTIKFSHYGFNKKTYEKIHRGLNFEKAKNNILTLAKHKNRPSIIISLLLLKENESEMNDYIKYWKNKVDEVMIWMPHNFGGRNNICDYQTNEKKNKINASTCGRPFNCDPYIHYAGQVSVCFQDFNKELIIGDLNKQSLEEILKSNELKKIQELHEKKEFDSLICKNCDQIYSREDALIYSSNPNRKVNQLMLRNFNIKK